MRTTFHGAAAAWLASTAIGAAAPVPASSSTPPAPPAAPTPPPSAPVAPTSPAPAGPEFKHRSRPDLAGAWRSDKPLSPPYVQFVFTKDGSGAWKTLLTIPEGHIFGRELEDAVIEGGTRFHGTTMLGPVEVRLDGALADDGASIKGTVELRNGEQVQNEPLTLVPTVIATTVPGAATYTAVFEAMGMKLPIGLTIADAGDDGWVGTCDIPSQGLNGLPVTVEASGGGALTITLPVGVPAVMQLMPEADGAKLVGTMQQGPVNAPISFERSSAPLAGSKRPQNPVPPFPYREREVSVPCDGGHVLSGTLTTPGFARADRKVPGVVMLTGSGLQDRDEALMGHRPFLVIADALARAGVAVLRCDDRSFGKSTGDATNATLEDLAEDGRAMMRFLRTQEEIDPALCGYLGHSEGGITGPMAALKDQEAGAPVAFVVMLAGPGVSGAELLPVQVKRLMLASGESEEKVAPLLEQNRRVFAAIRAGESKERLLEMLAEVLTTQQQSAATRGGVAPPEPLTPDSPEVAAVARQLLSAWMKSFLLYEPKDALAVLDAPVLALNGDLDTQVDAQQNLVRVEEIRREARKPISARRYANLNHLFQPAKTGGVDEYGTIEITVDPAVLEEIPRWIKETTTRAGSASKAPPAPAPAGR